MKRVLFVDDEQKILDGLRRMLRGQRREWEMAFVDSGQAALEAMDANPFDVVVTDMRMPGMDGASLLGHVMEDHPSTVRFILSGHSEVEAALRSVPVAHQFLTKPCEAETIRSVVTRACELQALLDNPGLQAAIGRVDALPAVPRVYNQLTTALVDPEVSLDDVAAIVEQDVGITAKILQLVNSSFFGFAVPIEGIRQATSHIGTNMIRNLVLSMEAFRAFETSWPPTGFSIEREQAHALLSARIARHLIADKVGSEQAFLAAMLHDIGKLVLATHLPDDFDRLATTHSASDKHFWEIEEEANGVSHAEIGAYLLGIWGMPYAMLEAVANHHRPSRAEAEHFDVLGAVHVADALAHEVTGTDEPSRIDLEYLESTGVVDELPGWREAAAAEAGARDQEAA